jgi:hypothetical protein
MTLHSEVVPYEHTSIAAVDEQEAIQKATQWLATVLYAVDDETWLVVKQGARSIHVVRP